MFKYADDFYLLVPASNSESILSEIENITHWASANNLKINHSKTQEMIVRKTGGGKKKPAPKQTDTIERVTSINILGVTIQDTLSVADHVHHVVSSANQSLYALKVLKNHGLHGASLHTVSRSTLFSKVVYASAAWWGYANKHNLTQIQSILSKAYRWGLTGGNPLPPFQDTCMQLDQSLFKNVLENPSHVLRPMLPPQKKHTYNLRARCHNFQLPCTTNSLSYNFIHRMLFLIYIELNIFCSSFDIVL